MTRLLARVGPSRLAALLVAAALVANVLATRMLVAGTTWRIALGVAQAPLLVAAAALVLAGRRGGSARGRSRDELDG